LLKERCKLLTDFADIGFYFFVNEFPYEGKGVKKHFRKPGAAAHLRALTERYQALTDFSAQTAEDTLYALAEELEAKPAELIHPTRLAVSGLTGGPSLFEMLAAIGREHVITRMKKAVAYIENLGDEDA
jgi:glutamyl-tRNA synthetase